MRHLLKPGYRVAETLLFAQTTPALTLTLHALFVRPQNSPFCADASVHGRRGAGGCSLAQTTPALTLTLHVLFVCPQNSPFCADASVHGRRASWDVRPRKPHPLSHSLCMCCSFALKIPPLCRCFCAWPKGARGKFARAKPHSHSHTNRIRSHTPFCIWPASEGLLAHRHSEGG